MNQQESNPYRFFPLLWKEEIHRGGEAPVDDHISGQPVNVNTPTNGSIFDKGMREATGIGIASKIHHRAVHKAIPRVRQAGTDNPPNSLAAKPAKREMTGASQMSCS